jgi:hypothetical protein
MPDYKFTGWDAVIIAVVMVVMIAWSILGWIGFVHILAGCK